MTYRCTVCNYKYDESKEGTPFKNLPEDWVCPVCGVGKELFEHEAQAAPAKSAVENEIPSEPEDAPRTAAEIIIETMSNWGVKWVFGMVGHSNLGVADAVRTHSQRGDVNFIGIRHEGAGAFACSAYGKLTGKPAACLTIAGPGSTNLITGLYDAKLDGAPAIALTGQVPSPEIGRYVFQEIDLVKPFADVAGSQFAVTAASDFAAIASAACRNAILSKSPSQIILPDDAQVLPVPASLRAGSPSGLLFEARTSPSKDEVDFAAKTLLKAKRPFIIAGDGCRKAMSQVAEFAREFKIPVATTYRSKGFLPDDTPLACGVIGRSGTPIAGKLALEADVIIGLGTRFSKHSEVPKGKIMIQADIDPAAIGRLRRADCAMVGDVADTLPLLAAALRSKAAFEDRTEKISAEWMAWRAEKSKRAARSKTGAIDPAAVCEVLNSAIPENAIVSVDVGNVAYSFGRYFEAKRQTMLLSFYLGSIGCGLPAAMGAWCASREKGGAYANRPVVAVVGDGGLGQYLAEWTTVAKYGMDIKCVVFNNSELAKISLEQRNAHFKVWETSLVNPNFADFAKSCGTAGERLEDPADLKQRLTAAMAAKGPSLIEIATAP